MRLHWQHVPIFCGGLQFTPTIRGFVHLYNFIHLYPLYFKMLYMFFKYYSNFISWLQQHQLPCIIKKVFLIECPGCGLQRSFIALLNGNIVQSLKLYPALLVIIIFFTVFFINKQLPFIQENKLVKIGLPFIFILILGFYFTKLTLNFYSND